MSSVGATIAESARVALDAARLVQAERQAARERLEAQRAKQDRLEHIQLLQSFLNHHGLAIMVDEPFVAISNEFTLEYAYPRDGLPQAVLVGVCPACELHVRSDAFSTLVRLGELLETFQPAQHHMRSDECWQRRPSPFDQEPAAPLHRLALAERPE